MLFGAVSVLVVLASGDPGDGSSRAIEQALRAAIGHDATVVVKPAPKASEEEIAALGEREHAGLVCVVTWGERERRVVVKLVKVPGDHFAARELRFEPADAANERGRTVGFALASMMPDEVFADPPPDQHVEAPKPEPAIVLTRPSAEQPIRMSLPRPNPLAIDAVAIAAGATDDYGGGVGGMFALRVPITGALGFHSAFSARTGSIGPAAASLHDLGVAAGLAWQPWLDSRRRWAAGARLDLTVSYLDVDHLDEDDTHAKHLSRFLPGAFAAAEGTYRFSDQASIVSAVGSQVDFGETHLFLEGRHVGEISPLKLVAELGLRVSFP